MPTKPSPPPPPKPPERVLPPPTLRERLEVYLEYAGPSLVWAIALDLGVSPGKVEELVAEPWILTRRDELGPRHGLRHCAAWSKRGMGHDFDRNRREREQEEAEQEARLRKLRALDERQRHLTAMQNRG